VRVSTSKWGQSPPLPKGWIMYRYEDAQGHPRCAIFHDNGCETQFKVERKLEAEGIG
jgi:hypothetical protein